MVEWQLCGKPTSVASERIVARNVVLAAPGEDCPNQCFSGASPLPPATQCPLPPPCAIAACCTKFCIELSIWAVCFLESPKLGPRPILSRVIFVLRISECSNGAETLSTEGVASAWTSRISWPRVHGVVRSMHTSRRTPEDPTLSLGKGILQSCYGVSSAPAVSPKASAYFDAIAKVLFSNCFHQAQDPSGLRLNIETVDILPVRPTANERSEDITRCKQGQIFTVDRVDFPCPSA